MRVREACRCAVQSVIVWALVSGQAALKETTTPSRIQSLPERAREGLAGKERPGRRCEADLSGRCARSGADDAAVWGFIEQKCDHFARATWTPASKHMRHDMMREEGRVGRTAEGHANAFRCALYVGVCMCVCVLCGVVRVLVCVCVCACVCLCVYERERQREKEREREREREKERERERLRARERERERERERKRERVSE